MRHIRQFTALIVLALLGVLSAAAQRPVHVHWTTEIKTVSATEGTILWSADIDEGWHIYGLTMPPLGPDAVAPQLTEFTVEPAPGLELVGNVEPSVPARTMFDQSLKLNLPMW